MITNIINPLLQVVSFISIWYLYQTMSKVKPLRGHLLLLFLSYVAAASYFNLVKIVVDPLFFLVADLALVKECSFYHRLLYAFYPTILFDMATRLLSIVILPHILHIKGDVTLDTNLHILTYILAPLIIFLTLKIFAIDLNQMSSLDEVWARRNWLRSTAFLAVYYVFFTVIHGLNSILPTANDPKNLFEIIFKVNANRSVILVLYIALLLWDFYNWNQAIHQQSIDRLNKERHKLLGTMTNYSKSFIQIITQKQKSFDLFKKNLKDVSLALENEDTAKATSLLEIYKTDNASIGNPETQEHLDRLSNPIIASFLSNRILEMRASHVDISINISPQFGEIPLPDLDLYQLLEMRASHVDISINISPQFGEIPLPDLDLYQLLQASDKAIFKLLRPDIKVISSYLQLDHSQLLVVELPVLADKVSKDKELNDLVKTLPNVDYRIGLHAGYLTQIIEIFEPGY